MKKFKLYIIKRWNLFYLLWTKVITFKYWWNYDYSFGWITIITSNIDYENEVLYFGKNLKLVGRDVYKVVDCDIYFHRNVEVDEPIHNATYSYDTYKGKFILFFNPN